MVDVATPTPHDLGEVWGKVEGLERNFNALDTKVETGFNRIFNLITENNEKTESRIERVSRDNQQSSSQRATNMLTIIGIVTSALIGIGGVGAAIVTAGFAFYSLTKAPIDQQFYQADKATAENKSDIKSLENNTVPTAQVHDIQETAKENSKTVEALGKDVAKIQAHQEDILTVIRGLPQVYATLDYTRSLDGRTTLLSQRLQTIYDKNFATPAIPCIGSGCAAQSAPTNGPQQGSSNSR